MGIGASIFLLAAGAVLAFAVTFNDATVGSVTIDWNTVGVILMIVGAIGLAWSLLAMNAVQRRRSTYVEHHPDVDRIVER